MRIQTEHAKAAKLIRTFLKGKNIPASVRSSSYAGGSSIRIETVDLTQEQIKAIEIEVAQYEYGSFDGMTDSYNYSNVRKDLPQVKYIFVENTLSDGLQDSIWAKIKDKYADLAGKKRSDFIREFGAYGNELIYRFHYSGDL